MLPTSYEKTHSQYKPTPYLRRQPLSSYGIFNCHRNDQWQQRTGGTTKPSYNTNQDPNTTDSRGISMVISSTANVQSVNVHNACPPSSAEHHALVHASVAASGSVAPPAAAAAPIVYVARARQSTRPARSTGQFLQPFRPRMRAHSPQELCQLINTVPLYVSPSHGWMDG